MKAKFNYIGKEIECVYEMVEVVSDAVNHIGEHVLDTSKMKSIIEVQNIPFHDFNQDFIHDLEFVLNDVKKVDKVELVWC